MNRRRRFVMAAATFSAVVLLVSPAGAATTAWTSGHLTKAVKGLTRYMNRDAKRDSRQGWRLKAVQHTNVIQNGKLRKLSAFRAATGGRLSALEAQDVIQAQLNGGILDLTRTVELPVGSPGAPHGGWMFFTLSGDSYVVYNGDPGPKGDQGAPGQNGTNGVDGAPGQNGAPGENGAPGLSAYQVWLAEGNTGTVGDFMKAITGPKGDKGEPGAPGQDGNDGSNGIDGAIGAPGLSAYQEWLAAGNTGSIADFLHSIVGPQGPKGDKGDTGAAGAPGQSAYQAWLLLGNTGTVADFIHSLIGPQGPKGDKGDPGIPDATQTVICTLPNGNNMKLGWGATACNGRPDAKTVYIPTP